MTETQRSIAIIGGGIGGLTAALALLRRGMTAHVYEQSAKSDDAGAGIEISPNGARVLDALGLADALGRARVVLSSRELRHWKTGETWRWPDRNATAVRRHGAHHTMMHRRDLHAILLDGVCGLDPGAVKVGKRCIGVDQADEQVEVLFESGEVVHAAYAIGADGIHSRVRECLFGVDKAEFTGCVAWRGLVAAERLPPAFLSRNIATNWLGPGGHVFHYPIRRGELMNFVGIVERSDWQVESWMAEGAPAELVDDFAGWHRDVHEIIQNIDTPFKWALMARRPLESWSKGRATLLGDACHPTLPFLGQGAVMAIEDAYVLASCLSKYFDHPPRAFERYEAIRRARTARVVHQSNEIRKHAFCAGLADEHRIGTSIAHEWQQARTSEQLEWLYEHDATSLLV